MLTPGQSGRVTTDFRGGDGFLRNSLGFAAIVVLHLALAAGAAVATPASGGWPIRPIEISPRMAALKQQIEWGDLQATDAFWQEALRAGTPLIEPAKDKPGEVIVTFVWRGDGNTRNVALLAPLTDFPGVPTLRLKRLLNTNLWYGCWQMRDDFRFSYQFAPGAKPGEKARAQATVDPLNPHKMEVSFEGREIPTTQFSIASMPHAADERWIVKRAGVPMGKVQEYTVKSDQLASERKLWVYTPPYYSDKEPGGYGLLVLFDGFSYLHWIPAPTILDNLIHAGKMPPVIAVLVDNPPRTRISDLVYNAAFVEFLGKEVVPWIHGRWNVTRDPQKTIVGGYSAGGAAAAFVAMQRPDLFGKVLSQSGAFWQGHKDVKWEWLTAQYEASPKLPLRFFLEAGLLEDVGKDGPTLLATNRHLVKTLKTKGYAVIYNEVGGTHEPVHWRGTFAVALMSLTK
jgi:enterochelin esterase-like enzyme